MENHAVFAQQVTRRFLAGHRVTVVPSLSAAREELTTFGYDLVLSDYDLDDGKGDVFVRELRAVHPDLPIVAVSSHDAGNAALLRAGASAVCSKMEFERIAQVIAGLTNESGKTCAILQISRPSDALPGSTLLPARQRLGLRRPSAAF